MEYLHFFQLPPLPKNTIGGYYNFYLVTLSYIVATLTSFVALEIASYIRKGIAKTLYWPLLGGAFAMGAGIFTMHFIGMLAFIMPMPMGYHIPLTILSITVPIVASGWALFIVRKAYISPARLLLSGTGVGIAIASMHYIGMTAMVGVRITYLPGYFSLSILIAIGASIAAIWLMLQCDRGSTLRRGIFKTISALIMGGAICGMHYTGMVAAVFVPKGEMAIAHSILFSPENLAFFLAFLSALILFVGLYAIGNQHSLFFKIIFGYLIVVSMMTPLAYTSIANINSMTNSLRTITNDAFPKIQSLIGLKNSATRLDEVIANANLKDHSWKKQQNTIEVLLTQFHSFKEVFSSKSSQHNEEIKSIHALANQIEELGSQIKTQGSVLSDNELSHLKADIKQLDATLNTLVDQQILAENKNLIELQNRAFLLQKQSYKLTFIIVVTVAILAFLLSVFNALSISKPIIQLRDTTDEIAKGNLQKRVLIRSSDEIGQLGQSFNTMVYELSATKRKRDEFVGMAAHDLRIPLGVIREGAQLLAAHNLGTLNPKQHRLAEMISKASASMMLLLDELLTVNAVQSKIIQIHPQKVDLVDFFHNLFTFNQLLAEKKQINLKIQNNTDEKYAFFDANKISQVINNFVSNAIKFSPTNTTVNIHVEKKGENLLVAVEDEAGGIPENEQSQVFTWFSKISVKPTAGEESHGLGLAICKDIIQAHQGTIGFNSIYGKGSIFHFEIKAFKQ